MLGTCSYLQDAVWAAAAGRRHPEVRREWETLGPQFPHLQNRDGNANPLGRWSPRKEIAYVQGPHPSWSPTVLREGTGWLWFHSRDQGLTLGTMG